MDTADATAQYMDAQGIRAVTHVASLGLDVLPLLHVTQTRTERNDLFGLDTLTLVAYATGRDEALATLERALALADRRPVFVAGLGLIDRLERLSAPVPAPFTDDLVTASAEITAEYRL